LRFFDLIVPCGIAGRAATSLEKVLDRRVERGKAAARLSKHFGEVSGLEMKGASRGELLDALERFEQLSLAVPA
jgi:lipoate-protein ligase B